MAMQALLDGEAEALTRTAVKMALSGDAVAMRMCLDRLFPVPKDRPVTIALPSMVSAADAAAVMATVVNSMARGEVTPAEAGAVAAVVETFRRTVETADIERRLEALEERKAP